MVTLTPSSIFSRIWRAVSLLPSPLAFMEIYTDASRRGSVVGIGYVIKLDRVYDGNKSFEGNHSSMDGEILAILEGLRIASQYHDGHVEIHTDCDEAARKLTSKQAGKWKEYQNSFEWLINKFDSYELKTIDRADNTHADRKAKEAMWSA